MTLSNKTPENSKKLFEIVNNEHICPKCKKAINISIEAIKIDKKIKNKSGIFSHLILHGNPLHGIVCYFDSNLNVRGLSAIDSIEFIN